MYMAEGINKEMAQRVWDRVQVSSGEHKVQPLQQTDGLQSLIVEEWQQAQAYEQLSRKLTGGARTTIWELQREKKAQIACLKGICTMCTGQAPLIKAVQPPSAPAPQLLRQCYGRQLRCLARYEGAVGDPEYGHVYKGMAEQDRRHCREILKLLGELTGK